MARVRRFPFIISEDPVMIVLDPPFSTEPISKDNSITHEGPWSINVISFGIIEGPEPPTFTVQVSNDGLKWDDYSKSATNIIFENSFEDDHFAFNNIRLKITPNGAVGGTARAFFNYRG